jgi:type III restriction enzyme
LRNGKILVVEYKGGHLAHNPDTNEKERLGNLWAERSEGQCLFRMIRTKMEFEKVVEAARVG